MGKKSARRKISRQAPLPSTQNREFASITNQAAYTANQDAGTIHQSGIDPSIVINPQLVFQFTHLSIFQKLCLFVAVGVVIAPAVQGMAPVNSGNRAARRQDLQRNVDTTARQYSLSNLTTNCDTGSTWVANPDTNIHGLQAVQTNSQGTHVIMSTTDHDRRREEKGSGNSIQVYDDKAVLRATYTKEVTKEQHDDRPALTTTVSCNQGDDAVCTSNTGQEDSWRAEEALGDCSNNKTLTEFPVSSSYASTYADILSSNATGGTQALSEASEHRIMSEQGIPGADRFDVTSPFSAFMGRVGIEQDSPQVAVKVVSTASKAAICAMQEGITSTEQFNTQVALYDLPNSNLPQEVRVPESARLVVNNIPKELNQGILINRMDAQSGLARTDLAFTYQGMQGEQGVLIINHLEQKNGTLDFQQLDDAGQVTRILTQGQTGFGDSYSRRFGKLSADESLLSISTPDNDQQVVVWAVDLDSVEEGSSITLGAQNNVTVVGLQQTSEPSATVWQDVKSTNVNGRETLLVGRSEFGAIGSSGDKLNLIPTGNVRAHAQAGETTYAALDKVSSNVITDPNKSCEDFSVNSQVDGAGYFMSRCAGLLSNFVQVYLNTLDGTSSQAAPNTAADTNATGDFTQVCKETPPPPPAPAPKKEEEHEGMAVGTKLLIGGCVATTAAVVGVSIYTFWKRRMDSTGYDDISSASDAERRSYSPGSR
ncbi:MAG: hypothetical protein K2Q33_04600 [Gammaproteobacteria bacterium]|nr:hypothetical protein [Gammaproteobacteria bacterium]